MSTIPVNIPGKPAHDIVVGTDILRELPKLLAQLKLSKACLIVSSPTISGLYGQRLADILAGAGFGPVEFALFPDGEEHKTLESWKTILETAYRVEEHSLAKLLFVNLGGGVVGDVGAFAAACYGRGRDYIQIPTTLLGHVDCGIGGKTAINFIAKNMVGAFYQPRLVLVDMQFLKTLPPYEMRSGMAEVIKYGVILDPELFAYTEKNLDRMLAGDAAALEPVVDKCLRLKVGLVEQDERDVLGIRAKLNFGHTIGHALEAASGYGRYSHGEAIAVGMVCACEIAEGLGMIDGTVTRRLEALFRRAGLPTRMKADVGALLEAMQHDKKFSGGINLFVLPTALGAVTTVKAVDMALVRKVVEGRIDR